MKTRFIYFIGAKSDTEQLVKIGITSDLDTRFKSISAWCPSPTTLIYAFAGTHKDEALLHRAFCRLHFRSEWFHRTVHLNSLLNQIIEHGFESMRPRIERLAKGGYGIRIKSEAGLQAIRASRKPSSESVSA